VEELSKSLAQGRVAFTREIETRAAAEKNLVEQNSSLAKLLELERHEWQKQLKGRDDSLKNVQKDLALMLKRLQAQQAAAAALKEKVVSLEMQQEEREVLICNARMEALAEREARIAAEEQAQRAVLAQESLKKQLVEHKEREQRMQAHVASLNSLFRRTEPNGASRAAQP
jgi:hypothetical protein